MAFMRMLWLVDDSDFRIKVKTKIRNAISAPLSVKVTVSIRNYYP